MDDVFYAILNISRYRCMQLITNRTDRNANYFLCMFLLFLQNFSFLCHLHILLYLLDCAFFPCISNNIKFIYFYMYGCFLYFC